MQVQVHVTQMFNFLFTLDHYKKLWIFSVPLGDQIFFDL